MLAGKEAPGASELEGDAHGVAREGFDGGASCGAAEIAVEERAKTDDALDGEVSGNGFGMKGELGSGEAYLDDPYGDYNLYPVVLRGCVFLEMHPQRC